MTYAEGTSVSVERSKAELDHLLSRAGASQRMIGSDDDAGFAFAVFRLAGRHVRLRVPLPRADEFRFTHKRVSPKRTEPRAPTEAHIAWEQGCRARWRGMVLLVKAKLEAVALGLSTPEREFMADIYLPNGRTIHEELEHDISQAYLNGKMPPLLGMGAPTQKDTDK